MYQSSNKSINNIIPNTKTEYELIDSNFRNINPINILGKSYTLYNALSFTENSNIIKIKHQQHPFKQDDRILIKNLKNPIIKLKNVIEFIENDPLVKINYSHNFKEGYKITISNIIGNSSDGEYLNNIPITLINTTHTVYLSQSDTYFYIKLEIIPTLSYIDENNIIHITVLNDINSGIPLNNINSDYPLSESQTVGYHIITKTTSDEYFITIKSNSNASINNVGNYIDVIQVLQTITGYPYPNIYNYTFKKTYYNVVNLSIQNSEFPISRQNINNTNNKLYIQILDDGNEIYVISLDNGSYNEISLANEIEAKINNVKRNKIPYNYNDNINKYIEYNQNIISKISINMVKNIISFELFQEFNIPKCITISDELENNHKIVIINHANHKLSIGNEIYIRDSIDIDNIPANIINTKHIITSILDNNNYTIQLPFYNELAIINNSNGGNNIKITTRIKFRLLFNKGDTCGELLGFYNVSHAASITKYEYIIRNIDLYPLSENINSNGERLSINGISILKPKYNYIFMTFPNIDTGINIGNIKNIFAKIGLYGEIGKSYVTDNHYILANNIKPITDLTTIIIAYYYPDGTLYEFDNINHSFILTIHQKYN